MYSDKEDINNFQTKFHSTNDVDVYQSYFLNKKQENFQQDQNDFFGHNEILMKSYNNRHEKFQYEKYLKKPKEIDRTDLTFQLSLRKKFVETAKKYIGTPYNKKYNIFIIKISLIKF